MAITVTVCASYLCSSAATSCTCDNRPDIIAFYNKQVAQNKEYAKQRELFRLREGISGEKYNWDQDRANALKAAIKKAVDAIYYDPAAWQISANTTPIGCKINNYTWIDPADKTTTITNFNPPTCLKEVVDAHEQVHIDACNRTFISLFYLRSQTMAEYAAEEMRGTQAGMDNVLRIKDELMRQFCCDTVLPPLNSAQT